MGSKSGVWIRLVRRTSKKKSLDPCPLMIMIERSHLLTGGGVLGESHLSLSFLIYNAGSIIPSVHQGKKLDRDI